MTKELIVDVTGKPIESTYIEAGFDEGLAMIETEGYRMPTIRETAMLRMQEGANSRVSRSPGHWTLEGIVTVPDDGVYIVKTSPVLANLDQAMQNYPFPLTPEQLEEALSDSVKVEESWVKVDGFVENPVTRFIFGDVAQRYEDFLKEDRMKYMPLFTYGSEMPPIGEAAEATQFWFRCLDIYSPIIEWMDECGKVRGIREGK